MVDAARVLHVDDDPEFADLAARYLERAADGLAVDVVDTAQTGLERLVAGDYHCVVSDYDMPGMNGIEFLETVRDRWPDLPFVLFTGKGSEEVASDAISAGVTDYMQKGTGTDQYAVLANRVVNAVDGYRTERALERSRERMTFALERHDAVVWERDVATGDLHTFPNAAVAHEALEETPLDGFERVHPEDRQAVEAAARAALEDGEPYDVEHRTRTDEGTRWLREQAQPAIEDGTVTHMTGITRDITDRKRRERSLERRVEGFEALGDVVADELGGAVRSLRGQPEGAVEDADTERAEATLATLDRLATLVDDLAATMRAGGLPEGRQPVAVGAVAGDVWTRLGGDGAALTVTGDPQVVGDEDAVRLLLEDLLRNAGDHGAGDDVSVRVGALEDGFFVEDDGPGIPSEERERVFEPGYSTKDAVDGTGLGLARVRQAVTSQGWRIRAADPEALGGARFEVRTAP